MPQAPTETIRGRILRVYFSSATFSAGVLLTDEGEQVKFRGRFCAVEGDHVNLCGRWIDDERFGRQFDGEQLSYELPESRAGLVHYLANHPAFVGVGPKIAERLVEYARDSRRLDELIRNGLDELHSRLKIPVATLTGLREAWIANADDRQVRTYLAGFGLTHHQIDVLLENFGAGVVGVLRSDPYMLIRHVAGYGFKRVDKKARVAAQVRLEAALALPAAIAADTTRNGTKRRCVLGDCLVEVRNGVGAGWSNYPVVGATRAGLAPAKEGVGKAPNRYKLVDPVTVFYNPMRILLGSIAMVDEGNAAGITSPDYVVIKGQPGVLDTRWFYYWFRSAKGAHLIESLSRGAVRERILFNRLAAGEIEIPDYATQRRASEQMRQVLAVECLLCVGRLDV